MHTPYISLLPLLRHRDALTAALATKHAEVVASVLDELAARGGLDQVCILRQDDDKDPGGLDQVCVPWLDELAGCTRWITGPGVCSQAG